MYPYGSSEWLEGIQTLLVVGWLILAVWLVADNALWGRSEALKNRKPAPLNPTDECKVGMTTRAQCTHCNPKDDDAP